VIAARRLLRRSHRQQRSALLVEGRIAVAEALRSGARVDEIFVSEMAPKARSVVAAAAEQGAQVVWGSEGVLAALSDAATPQGIVAVVRSPLIELDALEAGDLVVVLAQVRDPGNAGTLLRSGAAAGASAVIFTHGAVDPLNPKTVRAAAGALFSLPVVSGTRLVDAIALLRARGLVILGASARAGHAVYDRDLSRPTALILGNESWGLPPEQRGLLDDEVGIPMPGPVESLNVGVAGSVLLFEAARQRRVGQALAGLSSAPRNGPQHPGSKADEHG
jgi:TrmH family RNA methyltransferase